MTEFSISMLIFLPSLAAMGMLLETQWNRFRCAHSVFEWTHAALSESHPVRIRRADSSSIDFTDESAIGSGRCGNWYEKVTLHH